MLPSPRFQYQLFIVGEVPAYEDVSDNVIGCGKQTEGGVIPKVAFGFGCTVIVFIVSPTQPSMLIPVSKISCVPGGIICFTFWPVAVTEGGNVHCHCPNVKFPPARF